MSIIQLESGTQTSTAAKAFCSICLAIALITQPLSILLQDLQILLFWSGIIFIILSILPLLEWVCINLPVECFYDRHLPKGAYLLRSTLNQPFWDRFRNDTIRDLYLIAAFVTLILRQYGMPLFDQVLIGLHSEFNALLIPICMLLAFFVISRLIYRLYNHFNDIKLIQHYLTIVTTSGEIIDELNTYYINKAIPLFRQRFLVEFKEVRTQIETSLKEITTFLSYEMIDNRSHFRSIQNNMRYLSDHFSRIRLRYHISFKDSEAFSLLENIDSILEIIANVFEYLFQEDAPEGVPSLLFSLKSVQEKKHWDTYSDLLNKALKRANYDLSILSNDNVNFFYENLSVLTHTLEDVAKRLDSFIIQGEKDRGFTTFLKTIL